MNEELELLRKQQAELTTRIAQLEREERERKEQEYQAERARVEAEELSKPITLTITRVIENRVYVRSDFRRDLVALQQKLPSRWWHSLEQENSFDIRYWSECIEKMSALPFVTVEYANGTQELLATELAKPDYEVTSSPDDKFLLAKVGRADALIVSRTPGALWDSKAGVFKIPIVEGWRLYDRLKNQDKVLWHDHALKLVTADIERRTKLDEIALRKESSLHVELCGNELRTFQKVGVEFADAAGGRIIIADQMGLGKTWQAVAYAQWKNLRTLVICPASLKANWAREIKRLTGEIPAIHTGSVPGWYDVKQMVTSKSRYHIINYDILAKKVETSDEAPSEADPSVVLKTNIKDRWLWVDLINMSQFDLIVLDESHYIKNIGSLRSRAARLLEAPRIVAMTGTPVLNRPGELWPVLTLLQPEKFPSYEVFLSQYTWNNQEARNVDELRELLKPLMIRRLKKDVVAELPPVNRIYRWTELSPKAEKLSQRVLKGIYESLAEWDPINPGSERMVPNILVQIMRLKQIASVDRIDYVADMAVEINDSLEERNGERKDNSHKVLVFTQFVPIAHAVARRLGNETVWLTGELNAQQRDAVIQQFKTDPKIRFLVATDKVASEGLNLQEAHAVVFADLLWTPAAHEQCEGRAYGRLADLHGIDSYWCAAERSIDEHILKILDRKLRVINQVVEGIDAERGTSVVKELLQVLKEEMGKKK